jgi:hypothetical protein
MYCQVFKAGSHFIQDLRDALTFFRLISLAPYSLLSLPTPATMAFVTSRSTWAFCVCLCLASLAPASATSSNSRAEFPQDAYWDVKCTSEVTDLGTSPVNRWGAAKADLGLSAINRHWNQQLGAQGSDVTLNYVNSMMNFLGMPEQNCGLVSDSCDFSSLSCMDQSMANPSPKTPAHWLILRSLSNFHSVRVKLIGAFSSVY